MDNTARIERIKQLLSEELNPGELEVIDDSHLHAGHAGAREGKGHFTVIVKSSKFEGLSRLKQQQMVFGALGDMMQTDIHALVIKAST